MNIVFLEELIKFYLLEDIYYADITTEAIYAGVIKKATIKAKEDFIVAGLVFIEPIFDVLKAKVIVDFLKHDGDFVKKGDILAVVEAKASALLEAERLILNILARLSGIATKTHKMQSLINTYKAKIADTRKTTPGFRYLEKYAVSVGGGVNHRIGLFDAVLIKDNHIKIAGDIKGAINLARKNSFTKKIEVEISSMAQVEEAIAAKADIIMLDNMSIELMKEVIDKYGDKAIFEASGNINESNIKEVAKTGVDYISSGSIIHHATWVDINMKIGD